MPYKTNELVQVKLRVQHSLNEYPGRSRDYFIAITGPGIQLGSEDPNIAPRCRLIRQNIWEKELWLPKECRIHYKFLIVYSCTGTVKDIENVLPRQLYVGQFSVTMEHVYNKTDERKIIETNKKVNRYQNKNRGHNDFSRSDRNIQEHVNKCVTKDAKTGGNILYNEEFTEEFKVENRVPLANDLIPKQEGVYTKVTGSQINDNNLTKSTNLDSEKFVVQSVSILPDNKSNQTMLADLTTVTKVDDPSTTDTEINQHVQPESDDNVDITKDSNEMEDMFAVTTTESVITTTETVNVTNAVSDKKGGNCDIFFGRKVVVVAMSCMAVAGLGYIAFFRS